MSTSSKCELYKVVIPPVVTYSEETGVMNRADNKTPTRNNPREDLRLDGNIKWRMLRETWEFLIGDK